MKIRNKLKNKKGFTLTELLVTSLIVLLLTIILTTLTTLAAKHFTSTTKDANAQVLASTLTNAIEDELRYATNVKTNSDKTYTYFSTSLGAGKNSKITSKNLSIGNLDVRDVLVVESDLGTFPVISYGSYVFDLNASIDTTYENGRFNVDIKIKDRNGKEIVESKFVVVPMNPQTK